MLKWTSESEYFLSFEKFFADTIVYIYQSKSNHLTPLPGGGGGGGGGGGNYSQYFGSCHEPGGMMSPLTINSELGVG